MNTPTNLSVWLNDQAWPLAILIGVIVLTYVALKMSSRRRRQALLREREGVTEETFTAYLEQYGFDPAITAATYRYLQQVQRVNFPILPSDKLDEDLGLGMDEMDQTVTDLSAALGRERNPGLIHVPLSSVEDLVRLIQASPRATQYTNEKVA